MEPMGFFARGAKFAAAKLFWNSKNYHRIKISIDIILAMYQRFGMDFRLVVDSYGNRMKPQQSKEIYRRMLEIDQGSAMPAIPEEEAKQEKKATWGQLKDKISSLEKEEAKTSKKKK